MMSSAHPWERGEGRTEVCFRYITKRRPHRAYDVYVSLRKDPPFGEIDIRHAARMLDDMPPFTSGFLSVSRLRAIAGLIGLIERVTSRDVSRVKAGALVFGGHVCFPFERRVELASAKVRPRLAGRGRYPACQHSRGISGSSGERAQAMRHPPPRSERYRRHT
jgi:hypothetical protein